MRGLYTVQTKDGPVLSKARGLFREDGTKPIVGDFVTIRMAPDGDIGYIEEVDGRENQLLRPPVANIDRVFIVMSVREPNISLVLLDRFLVMCEREHLSAQIVLNKSDLIDDNFHKEIGSLYENMGYEVIYASTITKEGLDAIHDQMKEGTTAFAGPSGVGKSSILQALIPGFTFETGEISEKNKRGRHTTRHIEITPIGDDAYVLDTPGFSSLELIFVDDESDLSHYFPDFPQGECRFDNCLHRKEPHCAVKAAVEEGTVAKSRYENYLTFLEEIEERRKY